MAWYEIIRNYDIINLFLLHDYFRVLQNCCFCNMQVSVLLDKSKSWTLKKLLVTTLMNQKLLILKNNTDVIKIERVAHIIVIYIHMIPIYDTYSEGKVYLYLSLGPGRQLKVCNTLKQCPGILRPRCLVIWRTFLSIIKWWNLFRSRTFIRSS